MRSRPNSNNLSYGNLALDELSLLCREQSARPYAVPSPGAGVRTVASPGPGTRPVASPVHGIRPPASPPSHSTEKHSAGPVHSREEAVRRADLLAVALKKALLEISLPIAAVAMSLVGAKSWFDFGFARVDDFARERLGRSGRWIKDLAALHEAIERLPGLAPALTGADGDGPIGRVAALLIGRSASSESLANWLAIARRSSVRELRTEIQRARDAGSDAPVESDAPQGTKPQGSNPQCNSRAADPKCGTRLADPQCDSQAADRFAAPTPEKEYPEGERVSHATTTEDDPADRSLVRVPVPAAVSAAFDEAADLFRSVEGGEATVTSFVEALVAEDAADGSPIDADRAPLATSKRRSLVEAILARTTDNWRLIRQASESIPVLALAGGALTRLESIKSRAGQGNSAELLDQMQALLSIENEMEIRLGRILADMANDGAWARLRFAGIGHYAEERLGLSRSAAENRARVARTLRRFPSLRNAYENGRIGIEAALTVARILDKGEAAIEQRHGGRGWSPRAAEEIWVARARESTLKRLRDEARLLGRRFVAESVGLHDGVAGPELLQPPADQEWHASLYRAPGTARRRVLRYGLIAAGVGFAGRDRLDNPATLLIPAPDVFLRMRLPATLAAQFLGAIESARRQVGIEVDAVAWDADWPQPAGAATEAVLPSRLAARTFSIRSRRLPAWIGLLALIEDFVLTWDGYRRAVKRRPCERIFVRDGWRCAAPGCTSRRHLESHHVIYRSRGGGEGDSNQICLCRFHHQRGEHGGLASCSGEAPLGVTWRLGRGELALWYRNERQLESDAMTL